MNYLSYMNDTIHIFIRIVTISFVMFSCLLINDDFSFQFLFKFYYLSVPDLRKFDFHMW